MKYLHTDAEGVYHLDHRLTPEVRAMLCAMSSRMPAGGIQARYEEIVNAIKPDLYEEAKNSERGKADPYWTEKAEERLCEYPLHPKVQVFFDKFVANYGHSSIMELTGSPSVYMEGISWYDAWLLFDNPLVAGQEFSTRAVRHKDWPMALSAKPDAERQFDIYTYPDAVPWPLKELHDGWFEVFEAEVEWWKDHLSVAANREALGIADKEPFRPALDRARWAIPGTISTGCSHTANLRTMARVLQVGSLLAQKGGAEAPLKVWRGIEQGYRKACPGLAEMGLREAVYGEATRIPAHVFFRTADEAEEVHLSVLVPTSGARIGPGVKPRPEGERAYVDPMLNHSLQVRFAVHCSLAVARDWHRHRTMYPWSLNVVRDGGDLNSALQIHPAYEAKSDLAREKVPGLLAKSTEVYDRFMAEGNQMQAALALPLGTRVEMIGQGGLRDALYMLELRGHAHGANFEYKAQALEAMRQLKSHLSEIGSRGFVRICGL